MNHIEKIKLMLGAPLRQIELTDEQFEVAHQDAIDTFSMHTELSIHNGNTLEKIKNTWIKKYTLANCKEILGRVRGKFEGKIGSEESPKYMDYKTLLNEADVEKHNLISIIN